MATVNNQRKSAYVRGSVARDLEIRRNIDAKPDFHVLRDYEGEAVKSGRMGKGIARILFFAVCMCAMGYGLVNYMSIRSDITVLSKRVAAHEQELNQKTLVNDDNYSKMVTLVDYDEIRKIAIEELGMVYASEDQIISYTRENSDYVRQLSGLSD